MRLYMRTTGLLDPGGFHGYYSKNNLEALYPLTRLSRYLRNKLMHDTPFFYAGVL
jgi:hypothetical protein